MATGIAQAKADAAMDAEVTGTVYIQLHVGDPGAAGTSNPAANTTREAVTFASAASGSKASNLLATWTSVSTTETYTDFSLWTASSGGTFLWSGTVSNGAVTAGDTFSAASGGLTLSMTGAA